MDTSSFFSDIQQATLLPMGRRDRRVKTWLEGHCHESSLLMEGNIRSSKVVYNKHLPSLVRSLNYKVNNYSTPILSQVS